MYKILKDEDKELEFNLESMSYFPSTFMESLKRTYEFNISTKYVSDGNIGVYLSNAYKEDNELTGESTFLLSPEDALKLSDYLKSCALRAMELERLNYEITTNKMQLAKLINLKALTMIKILIKPIDHKQDGDRLNIPSNYYDYNIIVIPYKKDAEGKEYALSDYSFCMERNLYQTLYGYASNMLQNGTTESMELVSIDKDKNKKTYPYLNVLKTRIIMELIQTEYINMDLYPEKALDNLFSFDKEFILKKEFDNAIIRIISIAKKDMERFLNFKPEQYIPIKKGDSK